ncbi:hypothetical protein Tco_0637431 [Tanacetum coccineum]
MMARSHLTSLSTDPSMHKGATMNELQTSVQDSLRKRPPSKSNPSHNLKELRFALAVCLENLRFALAVCLENLRLDLAFCHNLCDLCLRFVRDRTSTNASNRTISHNGVHVVLRYIDTRPNGDALRKYILEGPYTPITVVILAVPATDNSPEVPEQMTVETVLNMSPANKAHFESEKEAIHLILTGIEDEIYSTVDACRSSHDIVDQLLERLQQGLIYTTFKDVKTTLFWNFENSTSHYESQWSSYYFQILTRMMNDK